MVQHKPTPEEQLLKLIENPGSQGAGKKTLPSAKPASGSKGLPDFGKLLGFLSYFRTLFSKKTGISRNAGIRFDIKIANQILMALVISSVLYLAIDFFLLKPVRGNFLSQVATSEKVYPVFQDYKKAASQDFSNYEKALQRRNPFAAPGLPVAQGTDGAAESPVSQMQMASSEPVINQMMAGLKLVGISWGDEPLAMIEDAESSRTYFVKKNGEVKGMKVQDIAKEKVTLTYEGQEVELF